MSKKFIQDGEKVNINGREFDLELFLAIEPDYPLMDGWKRIYEPEVTHKLTNGKTSMAQPRSWDDGDRYLTRVSDLIYLKGYLQSER